jgi:hypothetical protein
MYLPLSAAQFNPFGSNSPPLCGGEIDCAQWKSYDAHYFNENRIIRIPLKMVIAIPF